MNAPLVTGAAVPLVNATRFRQAHEADWARLDAIVTRMEKRSIRALADEELLALPGLYRTTLSSLSVARDTSLDRSLITYLEQLSTRAYFQIYGVQTPAHRQIARFFASSWPEAVRSLWRETLFCAILTFGSGLLAYLLVLNQPSWFYAIVPEALAGGRDPSASPAFLRSTLYEGEKEWLLAFSTFLFQHNSQVAIFAFALGFAFAVPTILLILYNGLSIGAVIAVFASKGLGPNLMAWLAIHGTTEIFAICIAGAAGVRIGMAIAFPGALSRMESAIRAGRSGATAMVGVVIMLAVAGVLEGVGRQTIVNDGTRLLIGGVALAGWLLYFYVRKPRRPADGY